MTKFRVFVHSPLYLVIRRIEVEADDSDSAIEAAKYELFEKNREDPDADYWVEEIE